MARGACPRIAGLFLALWCVACGARSDIADWTQTEVPDATTRDATLANVTKRDAGRGVRNDAGLDAPSDVVRRDSPQPMADGATRDAHVEQRDATPDSPVQHMDARSDAPRGVHDAAPDAPADASRDAAIEAETGCPADAPVSGADPCTSSGEVCQYAEWSCTCHPPCACGNPVDCGQLGLSCGPAGLPCDLPLQCGNCPAGQSCGGGGIVGVCAPVPDASDCVPRTCKDVPGACGIATDGCGAEIDCGACLTWSCTSTQICPRFQPKAGAPCEPAGANCVYTAWLTGCCTLTFVCTAGAWSMGLLQCPE